MPIRESEKNFSKMLVEDKKHVDACDVALSTAFEEVANRCHLSQRMTKTEKKIYLNR